jgi:uncharacterized protein
VLWTGVTTCAGFGSLTFAAMPPVRNLGLWTAFGIAVLTFEAFLLYPALLTAFGGGAAPGLAASSFERVGRDFARALAEVAVRYRRTVLAAFALVTIFASAGLARLPVGLGILDYLRPDHPLRAELERLEARGVAVVAGELVVDGTAQPPADGDPDGPAPDFATAGDRRRLRELAEGLRARPGVLGTLSSIDLLDAAARGIVAPSEPPDPGTAGPDLASGSALAALRANPELEVLLAATLTRDDRAARVSVLVPMASPGTLEPIFAEAVAEARSRFPGARVWLTGAYPLVVRSQSAILHTMLASLALTLAVVGAVFALLVRSAGGLWAALAPNLFPVVSVLGLMGWIDVPLDGTTLMIAAVVLGLAVDDTLHTLGAFRRRAPRLGSVRGAVAALEHAGPGHLLSTATLALGFLLCGLSAFAPVARFGRLTATALLVALAADLLLLPALLAGLGRRQVSALSAQSGSPGPESPAPGSPDAGESETAANRSP